MSYEQWFEQNSDKVIIFLTLVAKAQERDNEEAMFIAFNALLKEVYEAGQANK